MSNKRPLAAIHHDIEVRRHLLHLRRAHARKMGLPPPAEIKEELRKLEPPKKTPKEITTIRFSSDVLAAFKATGKGWQTRMDNILRELVKQGKI